MTQATLPARPNLEYLKKLAKKRLRAMRAAGGASANAKLADAQLAVTREYGFASWRKLKSHVDARAAAAATAEAAVKETAGAAAAPTAYEDPFVAALPARRKSHKIVNWNPLMDAAYSGDVARARNLLDAGADPDCISTTPHRYRPLHRAIESKKTAPRGPQHERVVELLLERGADPKLRATFGQLTALQLAATGETRFIPILLPHFQPLDIFHAAALGDDQRVAALLKRDASLATARDVNDWTALHYCCASATFKSSAAATDALVRIAKSLLMRGADPMAAYNFNDTWPMRPLYHCCGLHDNPAVAELLFRAGATPYDDETVYHAADEGHAGALALIEKYSDPKLLAAEAGKNLAAMFHWGHTRGAAWLLAHGADPNAKFERFGETALHGAVRHRCNDKIVRLLLDHGADPNVKNRDGKSACLLASQLKAWRILKLFEPARTETGKTKTKQTNAPKPRASKARTNVKTKTKATTKKKGGRP